ncbi:MAG: ATP-dependent helicase [Actinobacteria bacterium]|nr:MAG: ATP-dependent helicase [Actinomycetota bacterium]
MSFAVGTLVRARGREWVVLPDSADDFVLVRPLGGTDAESTGILTEVETVEPATFELPDPADVGDYHSTRLLRDAMRLSFRSSAGPLRSIAQINVDPRPYQYVPLLMALKLDPVRLLIADDVGIGKTIEAALIARELLDSGEASRLAVLCPPHLAEQWQRELSEKFRIETTLVLASTAARLERALQADETIFDVHPHVIVSTDFIKADRHRDEFIRTCPELVIVDEAHTCSYDTTGSRGRHQRHELVSRLASDASRHLLLVTATPHSGKEGAFRSLLSLLSPEIAELPENLAGEENRRHRDRLARHLVMRRRGDIRHYLETDTEFPDRQDTEVTYSISGDAQALFDDVLAFARERVREPGTDRRRQRVQWWSALSLLRAMASSPAAAAATMRARAGTLSTTTVDQADEVGSRLVLDLTDDTDVESSDVPLGADADDDAPESTSARRRLRAFADRADALAEDADPKLERATKVIKKLVADGFNPIVFCRFIPTAHYVADALQQRLPKGTEVAAVTGQLDPAEREARIAELEDHERRVLVATDCLSEGINLQDLFDAVMHYDLPWNPTRLEQREGRVDRFGQRNPEVRVVTFYGGDNVIDEIVQEVLLRKHKAIRRRLGISIPVPGDSTAVMNAVTEHLLLRDNQGIAQQLPGMEELLDTGAEQLLLDWERAADKEDASRSLFAQHRIDPDEVARDVAEVRDAVGSGADVERFVRTAVDLLGGAVTGTDPVRIDLTTTPLEIRDRVAPHPTTFGARFDLPVPEGVRHLGRTDPIVSALAGHVFDTALDSAIPGIAHRAGAFRTSAVRTRTTLLLARYRFNLSLGRGEQASELVAEDAAVLAFTGAPNDPSWLDDGAAVDLLGIVPDANVTPAQAADFIREVVAAATTWRPHVEQRADDRADELRGSHLRVREAAGAGRSVTVSAQHPADVLGIYVLLPTPGGS